MFTWQDRAWAMTTLISWRRGKPTWVRELMPYIKSPRMAICPSSSPPARSPRVPPWGPAASGALAPISRTAAQRDTESLVDPPSDKIMASLAGSPGDAVHAVPEGTRPALDVGSAVYGLKPGYWANHLNYLSRNCFMADDMPSSK